MKLFLKSIVLPMEVERIYDRIGRQFVEERTVMIGNARRKVNALKMESTPGTVETIISLLSAFPGDMKLLDYGCGQHQSQYLRQMGFNVHSCDILDFTIPHYTKIDPAKDKLPFSDKQFDVTVISEVVEHVENPWVLLRELVRVTKQCIIVSTPNVVSKKSKEVFVQTNYLYWFTPDVDYHITPVFYWQIEKFCQRENLKLSAMIGNHEIFKLPEAHSVLDDAEVLVYKIEVS
jgi:2-polyprenyl-3-methyl-5-hydroxy-6-metoxy-1,4-benzoquinol methylase